MSLSRSLVAVLALSLAACGGGTPSNDASTNDSAATTDSSSSTDAGGMMMMTTDASADSGSSGGGQCGQSVVDCVCMCGQNAQCQTQCISANRTCGECVTAAQRSCCPTEDMALQQCAAGAVMASDAGPACAPNDQACILQRCAPQAQAFQACFSMAQQSDMACQSSLGRCFGSYPFTCPM